MTEVWYDLESVRRFIHAALSNENSLPIEPEDAQAAALALAATINGRDICKDMGIAKKRGQRGKEFNSDEYTLDHPAMGVALKWRSGGLNYKAAVDEVMKITGAKQTTAKKLMAELRPRAEKSIKGLDHLHAAATGTKPPKRKF